MPTPTRAFAETAARHGGVDPQNWKAVLRWYAETLPTLSRERIEEVLEELISRDGESSPETFARDYPSAAEVPLLNAAPPAPVPFLALGWIAFLRRLKYRMTIRSR